MIDKATATTFVRLEIERALVYGIESVKALRNYVRHPGC